MCVSSFWSGTVSEVETPSNFCRLYPDNGRVLHPAKIFCDVAGHSSLFKFPYVLKANNFRSFRF